MKRGPMKRSAIRRKPRSPEEFARVYGSKARVEWVQSLPCVGCGRTPSANAHTENEGKSRKGHHSTIAPLCPDGFHGVGCHTKFDRYLAPFDTEACRALVIVAAVRTDLLWRERTGDAA